MESKWLPDSTEDGPRTFFERPLNHVKQRITNETEKDPKLGSQKSDYFEFWGQMEFPWVPHGNLKGLWVSLGMDFRSK